MKELQCEAVMMELCVSLTLMNYYEPLTGSITTASATEQQIWCHASDIVTGAVVEVNGTVKENVCWLQAVDKKLMLFLKD